MSIRKRKNPKEIFEIERVILWGASFGIWKAECKSVIIEKTSAKKGVGQVESIVSVSEIPKADEIRDFLRILPEQAQQYIMGCVDMALLFSSQPPEIQPTQAAV
ncbi:MAG: hypothetical protein LBU77_05085 [Clostridiales bacterium]|nr:hypothetical protein [Clostridiales bacterium]